MPVDDEENKDATVGRQSSEVRDQSSETDRVPPSGDSDEKLEDIAQTEHEYLHERLRKELGREPTEEELDEWLRRHTEGY